MTVAPLVGVQMVTDGVLAVLPAVHTVPPPFTVMEVDDVKTCPPVFQAFTVMLCLPHSTARHLVRCAMAALVMQ